MSKCKTCLWPMNIDTMWNKAYLVLWNWILFFLFTYTRLPVKFSHTHILKRWEFSGILMMKCLIAIRVKKYASIKHRPWPIKWKAFIRHNYFLEADWLWGGAWELYYKRFKYLWVLLTYIYTVVIINRYLFGFGSLFN